MQISEYDKVAIFYCCINVNKNFYRLNHQLTKIITSCCLKKTTIPWPQKKTSTHCQMDTQLQKILIAHLHTNTQLQLN